MDGAVSTTASRRPVAIDLYAGAGGLSLGFEQAGFDIVAAAEIDPIHALTHRYNFPRTPLLCADLTTADADALRQTAQPAWHAAGNDGSVDIDAVVGGPPCQGFSVGGVRDAEDDRNSQLLNFVRLVIQLRPKVFCLENVAGLLEPRFAALRREAIGILENEGGYTLSGVNHAVNAAAYGVPQIRRRVLILGARNGLPVPMLPAESTESVTVGEALSGLPRIASYYRLLSTDDVELRESDYEALITVTSTYARRLVGVDSDPGDFAFRRAHDPRVLTNSLRTVHTRKTVQRFSRTGQGRVEPTSRLYRLAEDGVSRTLRAGTGTERGSHTSPRPIHPVKPRVITVREAARLHGYPDWFRFHATNWHGHRQIGNSVPPPLAKAAGLALIDALGIAPDRPECPVHQLGDPNWLWYGRTEASAAIQRLTEDTAGYAEHSR